MEDGLGQPLVVENKEGASGALGMAQVLKANADGYTITYSGTSPLVLAPHFSASAGYSLEDFDMLGTVKVVPETLMVPADSPYKTLNDLLSSKEPVVVAVPGEQAGSGLIVNAWRAQGLNVQTLVQPAIGEQKRGLDVGDYDAAIMYPGKETEGWIASGELRGLGIHSDERVSYWPNIPTFKEAGFAEGLLPAPSNFSLFAAPAGLPSAAVSALSDAVESCTSNEELRKSLGNGTEWMSPEETKAALTGIKDFLK
ncbi:hypothetical protein AU252_01015 [Pseudarthrobacter sulfonivorans]|uniref:Tripartite tricarboxylate transporter substrate binding protein n=2 Tax=Pseudarthrobacter sulfonivorans TaxID=121292 RepID=A0A0U3QEI3_9MICC|nr:hypothetical protein AU252_01015 [Pseudarthrobacter sulfonivorans]